MSVPHRCYGGHATADTCSGSTAVGKAAGGREGGHDTDPRKKGSTGGGGSGGLAPDCLASHSIPTPLPLEFPWTSWKTSPCLSFFISEMGLMLITALILQGCGRLP